MSRLDTVWNEMRTRHPRAILAGACAEIADRFDLPAWLLRIPALFALCQAPWMTGAGYLVVAMTLRTRLAALLPAMARPTQTTPPDPGHMLQRERFSALERRLARLEAAVTSDELKLRARFRDIGG